ncbi:LOW QUALITY PROTEIN: hypothetical protein PHMEG_00014017 [Phytophthora megakarya]|uniref:Uncharacterized protein n=1 Tax=Phytophthora megakarya TaxID=4795 RepID=A0A225W4V8_9STRA|nr:LOW QUALITY PROTEIN: hypothetical protein PHMEG_00014017 [Phytophthora megakarya]
MGTGELPRETGYARLGSSKYMEWQVLAYAECCDEALIKRERKYYEQWLVEQPLVVERQEYPTPTGILSRATEDSFMGPPLDRLTEIKQDGHPSDVLLKKEGTELAVGEPNERVKTCYSTDEGTEASELS